MYKAMLGIGCAVSILVLMTAGCESLSGKKAKPGPAAPMDEQSGVVAPTIQQGLPLSTQQRFSDVPLPAGLKKDTIASYVYESDTLQIGRMVYRSKAKVNELANFYISECPAADWQRESVREGERVTLVFRKPGKRLVVEIREEGKLHRKRVLELNLTPDSATGDRW